VIDERAIVSSAAAVPYCASSWEPTEVVETNMDAFASKNLSAIRKSHPKDVTRGNSAGM
jgi:hypothetical protein